MMLLHQARFRVKAAQDRAKASQDQTKTVNKVALEAEKDNDAAQKEVQELQRVMEPKRPRTHAATADDDEECEKQSKFQLRTKARRARWSILACGLWDG